MPTVILFITIPVVLTGVAFWVLYLVGKRNFFTQLEKDCIIYLKDMDAFLFKKIEESINLAALIRVRSDEGREIAEEADLLFSHRPNTVSEREFLFQGACDNANSIMEFFKAQLELASLPNYLEYEIKMRGVDATIRNIQAEYNETAAVFNKAMRSFPGSRVAARMKLNELDVFGN